MRKSNATVQPETPKMNLAILRNNLFQYEMAPGKPGANAVYKSISSDFVNLKKISKDTTMVTVRIVDRAAAVP